MTEIELKQVVQSEIDNAIGYLETETTEARRKAIQYYNRENFGNEVEGRSTIVTGEVAEAVDGALPGLMRVFTQGDEVVQFEPNGPGDEEKAKQATDYANWVFYRDNPGVSILHDWFKDALLQKNGILKVYWNETEEVNTESYRDLTEEELALLLADEQFEVVEQEQRQVGEAQVPPSPEEMMMAQQAGVPPMPQTVPVFAYDVKVKRKETKGRVRIENVPPEEFIISKKGRSIGDTPFCAHRKLVTRSELIAMGFPADIVEDLPANTDLTFTPERTARFSQGEQPSDSRALDKSMEEVEVFECYIRTDKDEDGIAELRKIVYAGNEILEDEEIDYVPFCSICPFPLPHKFFGHSMADRTIDLQLIKSTITRQILDNLYLTNNARVAAVDGQVNLDDLLTVTPGGVVRVKNPNALVPITVPPVASQSFPMLQYLDGIQEKRTGISMASQGLDPNILQNTTATAVAAMQNAAAGKVELIARIFAETGVRDLFKKILHLLCKYQDKPRVVRLRGKYVAVDPREWSSQYDVTVNVGLGTGNRQEQMAMLAMVLQKQEQILGTQGTGGPLVGLAQYRSTLGRFIESAGFKDSAEFFREITPEIEQQMAQAAAAQSQQGNPQMMALMQQVQAQIQSEQAKVQADIQLSQAKAQADIQLQREKAAAQIQLEREKAQAQLELKVAEFQAEAQIKSAKVAADITSNVQIPG
jgi:F0F1-type ATP synthase membrane subunit b/b'